MTSACARSHAVLLLVFAAAAPLHAQRGAAVQVHDLGACLGPAEATTASADPWRAIAIDELAELLRHAAPGPAIPDDAMRRVGLEHLVALATDAQQQWIAAALARNDRGAVSLEYAATVWELPEADYQRVVAPFAVHGELRTWLLERKPSEHYPSATGRLGMHVNESPPNPAERGRCRLLTAAEQTALRRDLGRCDAARQCVDLIEVAPPFDAVSADRCKSKLFLRDYMFVGGGEGRHLEPMLDAYQDGEGVSMLGMAGADGGVVMTLRCWGVTSSDPLKVRFCHGDDGELLEYQVPDLRCTTLQTVVEVPKGEAALLECGTGNGTRLVVMVRAQVRRR